MTISPNPQIPLNLIPEKYIEETISSYSSTPLPLDPLTLRPKGLIGPLQYNFLPESTDRKVMFIASITSNYTSLGDSNLSKSLDSVPKILSDFKIIERHNSKPSLISDCITFVFHNEDWFKKMRESEHCFEKMRASLFRSSPIHFLRLNGYDQTAKPKKNDIVTYFTNYYEDTDNIQRRHANSRATHYGKVIEVKKDGTVMVISKFGKSHIFEHRLDLVPYSYGNQYLYFRRSQTS